MQGDLMTKVALLIGLSAKLGLILLIKSKERTILTYNSTGRSISPKTLEKTHPTLK